MRRILKGLIDMEERGAEMRTTTYQCDRCKQADQDNKTLCLETVGVHVGGYNQSYSYGPQTKANYEQEWCLICRVATGLSHPDKEKKIVPLPEAITLEQLVHDIAYYAASEAIQNSR